MCRRVKHKRAPEPRSTDESVLRWIKRVHAILDIRGTYVCVVYDQLQTILHDRMLSRSRIAKIDDGTRLVKSPVIERPHRSIRATIYPSLYPSFFLFPPPLVQLGLISTRKREIAIGAGERMSQQ